MICTTLNKIRAHHPCTDGWVKLLAGLGKTEADDEPLPFAQIVEINGFADALWSARSAPEHDKDWRLFAVWCARQALVYTDDWRVVNAVNVAERYAHGMASHHQLHHAASAADAAASAAAAAYAADAADARSTYGVRTSYNAALAARAPCRAAADDAAAAAAATYAAAYDAQKKRFLEIVS